MKHNPDVKTMPFFQEGQTRKGKEPSSQFEPSIKITRATSAKRTDMYMENMSEVRQISQSSKFKNGSDIMPFGIVLVQVA